ncbi:unknown [Clostridium clostridioforme CAG:132]|uniref:Uncharacterized protein n=1 Tax=[Clostridium] clostridioforme CAG:132 TaxID=1263065 RepID=R6JS31_9FIRM|nr:unknown [[Clostridium] clostridioforme CAG:132]
MAPTTMAKLIPMPHVTGRIRARVKRVFLANRVYTSAARYLPLTPASRKDMTASTKMETGTRLFLMCFISHVLPLKYKCI